jgi:16S rRNA (cytidine1402-2'-O)-methyltransferase
LSEGTLYVVATPIGNLGDFSPRAREVLDAVDLIAAEDTRVTRRLLTHFGIQTRQTALHEHNEATMTAKLVAELQAGISIALVSDAGTPLISDPGFRLVQATHQAGIAVSPVPGASALVAALSVSGLPTDNFVFEGFLPAKSVARNKRLRSLANETRTTIFYASVHRIADTINDLIGSHGADRKAFLGRELTKLYEQCVSGDLQSIAEGLSDGRIPAKGEFVIAVEGVAESADDENTLNVDRLLEALTEVLPGKQAVAITAEVSGQSRNEVYRRMLAIKSDTQA